MAPLREDLGHISDRQICKLYAAGQRIRVQRKRCAEKVSKAKRLLELSKREIDHVYNDSGADPSLTGANSPNVPSAPAAFAPRWGLIRRDVWGVNSHYGGATLS